MSLVILNGVHIQTKDPTIGRDARRSAKKRPPTPEELEIIERAQLERMGQQRCYTAVNGRVVGLYPTIQEADRWKPSFCLKAGQAANDKQVTE